MYNRKELNGKMTYQTVENLDKKLENCEGLKKQNRVYSKRIKLSVP